MKKERLVLTLSQQGVVECFKWYDEARAAYQGVVLIVHGMAEHIERYDEFANFLAENGYIVYGHNQRGHKGSIQSDDDYGYMSADDNFFILVSDVDEIVDKLAKEYQDLPLYLFGHSMGSFVAQRYAQLHGKKIDGMILSGSSKYSKPLLLSGTVLSWLVRKIKGPRHRSKLLYNLIFGAFNRKFRPTRTDADWLNTVPAEVDKYITDKYCGGILTAAFYHDFLRCLKELNANYDLIPKDLPIMIISGEKDACGGLSKLIIKLYKKFKQLNIFDLTFKLYPEARHEIIHEKCKDEVYSDCLEWLNKRQSK
jgi:alpha-beta hydrolase superfamily lysophospholipase